MRTNTSCGGGVEALDTLVNNAITKRLGVPASAPIEEFLAALDRTAPRDGTPLAVLAGAELPYTQRLLAEDAAARASQVTGAIRRLRPIACCTRPGEAAKTIDAMAGGLREAVAALEAGLPASSIVVQSKLDLVGPAAGGQFSLLQRLASLYGLDRPAAGPAEEERLADFAQVKKQLEALRVEIAAAPPCKPASDALPEVRSKGNALACQLDTAASALDGDPKLECRWRQEPVEDMALGNLFTWTRAFVSQEVPALLSGFGGDVAPSLTATLRRQAERWEQIPSESIREVIAPAEIAGALRALALALPPGAPSSSGAVDDPCEPVASKHGPGREEESTPGANCA